MSTEYNRKHVFYSACMGMFIFGIVLSVFGAIVPMLMEATGLTTNDMANLGFMLTIGIFIGSIFFGPIVQYNVRDIDNQLKSYGIL